MIASNTVSTLGLDAYLAARHMDDEVCGCGPMRNDLLKSLYATMLMRFPFEHILEFWRHLPLKFEGRILSDADLFRHIWVGEQTASKEYVARALCCVEYFLVHRGYPVKDFIDNLAFCVDKGTPVPGKAMLSMLEPLLDQLYAMVEPIVDMNLKVLQLMSLTADKFIPGSHREVLKVDRKDGLSTAWVLFAPDGKMRVQWTYHSELIGLKMLSSAPRVLGLNPFEDIQSVADTGMVEHILWKEKLQLEGSRVFINGVEHGEVLSFRSYCRTLGLNMDKLNPPDWPVMLIHKPLHCDIRGREVLHAGCAYGAPMWIAKVLYPTRQKRHERPLKKVVDDINERTDDEMEGLHARLLEELSEKAHFTFVRDGKDKEGGHLLLNGNSLIKGVPGEFLAYMLRVHRDTGRNEFLLLEFKQNTSIRNSLNPNLERRLGEVSYRLTTHSQKVRVLIKKGVRILKAECPIEFEER